MTSEAVGQYRILEKAGFWRNGKVFRARDERLGRDVAQVCPSVLRGSDRLRRFDKEARAAAAPNHPNIVAIYGGVPRVTFIASELLEGQTPAHG
jgi:hypothetical protein